MVRIDWDLLEDQRKDLEEIIAQRRDFHEGDEPDSLTESLVGIQNLLDAIADTGGHALQYPKPANAVRR